MKIYTKTGDKGETGLVHGHRVAKNSPRVEAYGTVDEANSMIGLALSALPQNVEWNSFQQIFQLIQTKLFHIGTELATAEGKAVKQPITLEDVQFLEQQIDQIEVSLPELKNFILPGGHTAAATFHVARTVVRRAERCVVAVMQVEALNPISLQYLNRLSDFLFVAARYVNQQMAVSEQILQ